MPVNVYTKEELIKAKDNKYDEIVIYGELAEKVHRAKIIVKSTKYEFEYYFYY